MKVSIKKKKVCRCHEQCIRPIEKDKNALVKKKMQTHAFQQYPNRNLLCARFELKWWFEVLISMQKKKVCTIMGNNQYKINMGNTNGCP